MYVNHSNSNPYMFLSPDGCPVFVSTTKAANRKNISELLGGGTRWRDPSSSPGSRHGKKHYSRHFNETVGGVIYRR